MKQARVVTVVVLGVFLVLLGSTTLAAQVSGFVYEEGTMLPLAGARVALQATGYHTTTDASGRFDLPDAVGRDLVIVAAHHGYYNNFARVRSPTFGARLLLEPVPADDNTSYQFFDPHFCGGCHPNQLQEWSESGMAHAGVNSWVYDIYDGTGTAGGMGGFVYLRDSVHASSNPESECASCHQPEPWIENPFKALEPVDNLSMGALHGVSCEVCHKIAHIDESKTNYPGIYPGVVTVTRPEPSSTQVQYGMLGDTNFVASALMRPSYQPQLGAAMCAACHQDKNDPDEDGDYEESNGVISEPTYLEWLASPFGDPDSSFYATCVACHMPPSGETEACSVLNPPLVRDPETIRSHRIEGTTPFYLENAVDMSMDGRRLGNFIEVDVTVDNRYTGHHVPTGVTVRNVILLVEAWRKSDGQALVHVGSQTIHPLGGIGSPDQGYYAGLPGKLFAKINHDANGNGPTFYTDATGITEDSRIPALTADTTSYRFRLPSGDGTFHVRARLIYRRSFRFLTDAKQWTEDGHGNPLADVQPPYFGHLMEEQEWIHTRRRRNTERR